MTACPLDCGASRPTRDEVLRHLKRDHFAAEVVVREVAQCSA